MEKSEGSFPRPMSDSKGSNTRLIVTKELIAKIEIYKSELKNWGRDVARKKAKLSERQLRLLCYTEESMARAHDEYCTKINSSRALRLSRREHPTHVDVVIHHSVDLDDLQSVSFKCSDRVKVHTATGIRFRTALRIQQPSCCHFP